MIKPINIYPNDQLNKIAVRCEPVEDTLDLEQDSRIWGKELEEFVQDLKDTLNNTGGLGLAANQIWDKEENPPSVFVIKIGDIIQEIINPKIKLSGKPVVMEEGCLSRPGYFKKIKRKQNLEIWYQTLGSTEVFTTKFYHTVHGIIPVVIQHETDHLIGVVI